MQRKGWAVLTLTAAAVAAPSAYAQYPDPLYPATHDQPCESTAGLVRGVGASFARAAHLNWGAQIIAPDPAAALAKGFGYDSCSPYKLAGDGGTRRVTYAPSGSGAGLAAFGATDSPGSARNLNVDFGTTDKPPNEAQIANANEGPNVVAGFDEDDGVLHTIPIAQGAVAVAIRIPDGCQIPSAGARSLSRVELERFFRGSTAYDQWGELVGYTSIDASPGSGLTDAQCGSKKPKRVVRFDESGTTFIFKKYLDLVAGSLFDWREPAQGGALANNAWPSATINAGVSGNGPLLDTLTAQGVTGGIGYGDLGGARGRGYGWDYVGGSIKPDDRTLWVLVQRIADNAYVSPARVNDQLGAKGARCAGVRYIGQPAESTEGSWIDVDALLTATDYPICGLTYALAWESPAAIGILNFARAAGRRDYIGYLLDRPGLGTTPSSSQCDPGDDRYGKGQCKLPANDYARLPGPELTQAQSGAVQLGP